MDPSERRVTSDGGEAARMREDWNRRAREDAHYYVAFGRRNQTGGEFFATAAEQVNGLEQELKRLRPRPARSRRALEIGCGPGRLMLPMSRHFGEIHGVDVSDEMVARARENLAAIPHAHAHWAPDSDLAAFASSSFDFLYSYAVFQHIPSRDVVFGYLNESWRVLKPSGILRCQINGLPRSAKTYDTWSGVRISADEVREFCREKGFSLLALEGIETQYMWATLRKGPCWQFARPAEPRIRRITNAQNSEPAAPVSGPFSSIALQVQGLPQEADIGNLAVEVGGALACTCYLGSPEPDGLRQLNAYLPPGLPSGLTQVELRFKGERFCEPVALRLIPAGPAVPRLKSLTDGVDLLSGTRIVSGTIKATIEEANRPELLRARIDGIDAVNPDLFRTDPRLPRHELNFDVPPGAGPGPAEVEILMGSRLVGRVAVELA